MGTWRNNRRASRRDPAGGTATPWSSPASTANLRAWYPDETASIAAGTDTTGQYKVANVPNHASASLGGTIAQATAANQPAFSYCKGGKARIRYNGGVGTSLISSLAASNYKLLHQFANGATIAFGFSVTTLGLRNLINTKATAGTGTGVGITIRSESTGEFRVSIGDGTAAESLLTSAVTSISNFFTFILRMSQTETNKLEVFVNGISVGALATLSITPSASNPGATLNVGVDAGGQRGFLVSPAIWETYMSNADVAACHAWMTAGYGKEYATLAEIVADVATLGNVPAEIFSFNASGIVSNRAAHTATGVSDPAVSTNASYNNKYVFDCDGLADYYTAHTLSTNMSGTDKPFAFIFVGNQATTTVTNKTLAASGSSVALNNQHKRFEYSSGNVMRIVSVDDAAGSDVDAGATAIGTGARIVGMGHYGTTASAWLSLAVIQINEVANDVGVTTVDRFTLFALVQAGALAAGTLLDGKAACLWVWDTKGINDALYHTIYPALAGEFAL